MKKLPAAYLIPFILLLHGCSNHDSSAEWTTKDSWYHPPRTNAGFETEKALPDADVHIVLSTAWAKAQTLLKATPIVPLSTMQAKTFVGRDVKPVSGEKPFLVRAVFLNAGTGAFSVYAHGKCLWVDHGSLGHNAVPMKRQALVVLLRVRPTEVFATCSTAE